MVFVCASFEDVLKFFFFCSRGSTCRQLLLDHSWYYYNQPLVLLEALQSPVGVNPVTCCVMVKWLIICVCLLITSTQTRKPSLPVELHGRGTIQRV